MHSRQRHMKMSNRQIFLRQVSLCRKQVLPAQRRVRSRVPRVLACKQTRRRSLVSLPSQLRRLSMSSQRISPGKRRLHSIALRAAPRHGQRCFFVRKRWMVMCYRRILNTTQTMPCLQRKICCFACLVVDVLGKYSQSLFLNLPLSWSRWIPRAPLASKTQFARAEPGFSRMCRCGNRRGTSQSLRICCEPSTHKVLGTEKAQLRGVGLPQRRSPCCAAWSVLLGSSCQRRGCYWTHSGGDPKCRTLCAAC